MYNYYYYYYSKQHCTTHSFFCSQRDEVMLKYQVSS